MQMQSYVLYGEWMRNTSITKSSIFPWSIISTSLAAYSLKTKPFSMHACLRWKPLNCVIAVIFFICCTNVDLKTLKWRYFLEVGYI